MRETPDFESIGVSEEGVQSFKAFIVVLCVSGVRVHVDYGATVGYRPGREGSNESCQKQQRDEHK